MDGAIFAGDTRVVQFVPKGDSQHHIHNAVVGKGDGGIAGIRFQNRQEFPQPGADHIRAFAAGTAEANHSGIAVLGKAGDFRIGVDVMTTETTCLSSIWKTDDKIKEFYDIHGRVDEYKELNPGSVAYYDGMIYVDLAKVKPMIAMPFHPSNVYSIEELNSNLNDILADVEKKAGISLDNKVKFTLRDKIHNGKLYVEQGVIAGCAGGGFENICDAADILKEYEVHACTDVTGFGLLVHLLEMLDSKNSANIYSDKIPYFKECDEYVEEFYLTAAAQKNRNFAQKDVCFEKNNFVMEEILFDPQTSGGLLVSVPSNVAGEIVDKMNKQNIPAKIIGDIIPKQEKSIIVKG